MKKSNKYLKLISCLALCVVLVASMFLTACGEDSAPGSGNVDISKLTRNQTEPTTSIATEVPTEAEITEQVETTVETEAPTEKPTEEPTTGANKKDVKESKYDINITPISQYETKVESRSNGDKNVVVTCFFITGNDLQKIKHGDSGIVPKKELDKDAPYYRDHKCWLNNTKKDDHSYIAVLEMEKGSFELSDFQYHFELEQDKFDKELSFKESKTDILKSYVKDKNISKKDIFVNKNDFYYVNYMSKGGHGTGSSQNKKFLAANVSITLTPLTSNKTVDMSYNYNGKEDFSNVTITQNILSSEVMQDYNFVFQVEDKLFPKKDDAKLFEEAQKCSFIIKSSGLKIPGKFE